MEEELQQLRELVLQLKSNNECLRQGWTGAQAGPRRVHPRPVRGPSNPPVELNANSADDGHLPAIQAGVTV